MANFTILGSGGFGMSLAVMLNRLGHTVTVWSAFSKELEDIKKYGEHRSKLPGVKIPDSINLNPDILCINGSDIVLLGITFAVCQGCSKKSFSVYYS